MNSSVALSLDDICDCALVPSQFYDSRLRPFPLGGEYLLLWAVLEDAIRIYRANREYVTPNQRKELAEVYAWFYSPEGKSHSVFAFHTICDLLGIDSQLFLRALESSDVPNLPRRRYRNVAPTATIRCPAAPEHPGKDGSYRSRSNGIANNRVGLSAAHRAQQLAGGGL